LTLAEHFRKEGILAGKVESKAEIAFNLLQRFPEWTDLFSAEITRLTAQQVGASRQKAGTQRDDKKVV
jgi:hypothetical protein